MRRLLFNQKNNQNKWFDGFLHLLVIMWVGLCFASGAQAAERLLINTQFTHTEFQHFADAAVIPRHLTYQRVLTQLDDFPKPGTLSALPADQRLWYRGQMRNLTSERITLIFQLGDLSLSRVNLIAVDERERIIQSSGYQSGDSSYVHPIPSPDIVFKLDIEPDQTITVLLNIAAQGVTSLPITVWQEQAFVEYNHQRLILHGIAIGSLSILLTYFLVSYLYLRTPSRFWISAVHALFLTCVVATQELPVHWPGILPYSEAISTILVSGCLYALTKLSHKLFLRIPAAARWTNYAVPFALLASIPFCTPFQMTVALLILIPLSAVLQVSFALLFRDRRNRATARTYMLSWLALLGLMATLWQLRVSGFEIAHNPEAAAVVLLMLASLGFGICVELKERYQTSERMADREKTISSLHHFYDLFRNSAEGLYTSTLDGQLISVNPAMCALFGYENEQTMLDKVTSTRDFYANAEDRDVLVGEIIEKGAVMGREIKGRRTDGSEFWFSLSCQIRKEENGTYLYGSIFDITERKQSSISLEYMASHDALTGVFNRREFEQRLHQAVSRCSTKDSITLLYLDLDRFKVVNDSCGHKAGDVLIKEIAQELQDTLNGIGITARLGGDEFAVLFEGHSAETGYIYGVKLLNAIQSYRFIWENRIFTLGVSIGLVEWDNAQISAEQLLSMADAACYIAKEQGRNQIHRYNSNDESLKRYEQELEWMSLINIALQENQFELYYQHWRPLARATDGDTYEILIRLRQNDGTLIPPSAFLPTAERYSMGAKIDRWVVENTFKWLADHPQAKERLSMCSINLSGQSLADRDFKLFILNAFEKYAIDYSKICFEITESMAIIKMEDTQQFMRTFKQLGCQFALDDFGSGFSSYTHLKHLPVNMVKIDGSFIRDMLNDPVDLAMVSSIKDVAKALGMQTVGEFVESEATMVQLGKMGVDYAQGYGIAHPAPLAQFSPL